MVRLRFAAFVALIIFRLAAARCLSVAMGALHRPEWPSLRRGS